MRRRSRIARLALSCASLLTIAGCMRLDIFVYRSVAVEDDAADLMATSDVPADLREELRMASEDGTLVDGYLLKHRADDGTDASRHATGLLYAHGQNNHIGTSVARIDYLWSMGYTVLAYDARGYGKTRGTPSELTHYADARAARVQLEERMGGASNVLLYGRSLGTLFMTKLAAERAPAGLILESPVLSISTIIADSFTLESPVDWYVDSRMDNGREIAKVTSPVFIMHGTVDDYVHPRYGDALFDAATQAASRDIWRVEGADHGNVPCLDNAQPTEDDWNKCPTGLKPDYISRINTFVDSAQAR